jgi:hypothetical protein
MRAPAKQRQSPSGRRRSASSMPRATRWRVLSPSRDDRTSNVHRTTSRSTGSSGDARGLKRRSVVDGSRADHRKLDRDRGERVGPRCDRLLGRADPRDRGAAHGARPPCVRRPPHAERDEHSAHGAPPYRRECSGSDAPALVDRHDVYISRRATFASTRRTSMRRRGPIVRLGCRTAA